MSIWQQPATELARLILARELSVHDVVSAFLARIDAINPRVNAIVTLDGERAMDAARAADQHLAQGGRAGGLFGLPMAHKDLQATAGMRTTFGSPIFADFVPEDDSPLVAHLKMAGAITIGKTNTPEFGAGSQTFNPVFGATLNPYDTTKTCGGSSGGAAVALACDMLPLADGTDMGGSLRNPAAFSGVVGMRPSSPVRASAWETLSVDGFLARSVEDVTLGFDALSGVVPPHLRYQLERPTGWQDVLRRDFRGVRIAWFRNLGGLPFDSRVAHAVNTQQRTFELLGCLIDEAEPDLEAADAIFRTLRAKAFIDKHGTTVRAHRDLVKETIREEIARGERLTAADVDAAEQDRAALRDRVRQFMARYEFFVLPTTQVPPFAVDQPFVREIDGVAMGSYIDWMKSCYYISAIGYPAISVPCGFTPEGLPVGLQIVGRDRDDFGVLQLANAYERARGPFRRATA